MTADEIQTWVTVLAATATAVLGIMKYFNYRSRRDRVSLVGQAFAQTVDGLSSDAETKQLAAAVLLRRFFDEETEQGAAGVPYEQEAVAVIAALLRNTETSELQKLLADGLGYASTLYAADLQRCNLSGAYLGRRPRATVAHGSARLLRRNRGLMTVLARRASSNGGRDESRYGPGDESPGDDADGDDADGDDADDDGLPPLDMSRADLFEAKLDGASLRGAIAQKTVFYRADARGTVFEKAHLEEADFRDAQLAGARFEGAWLEKARFEGAHDVPPNVESLLDERRRVPKGRGMPVG